VVRKADKQHTDMRRILRIKRKKVSVLEYSAAFPTT
jgi:hypothetical protein